jgi:alkylhydroperoxidase family enzyme
MVEQDYDELLDFERSDRYDDRQKAALLYTSMIVWNPAGADDAVWDRLRTHFTPEEIAELGYFISFISVQQRWIKTLGIGHGEVLAQSGSGLSPDVAREVEGASQA